MKTIFASLLYPLDLPKLKTHDRNLLTSKNVHCRNKVFFRGGESRATPAIMNWIKAKWSQGIRELDIDEFKSYEEQTNDFVRTRTAEQLYLTFGTTLSKWQMKEYSSIKIRVPKKTQAELKSFITRWKNQQGELRAC